MRGAFVILALLGACDSKATASDPAGAAKPEQKSKELESCANSGQCAEDLRCFDHTCRRTARSNVGDYHAAVGAAALARGDADAAIAAYEQAIAQYDAEKVKNAPPPDIDCAYGAALAAGKAKQENADKGAMVLHRCLLNTPMGSSLRDRALAALATLADTGLDPLLLGATKTGTRYVKGPAKPAGDKVSVNVSANPALGKYAPLADKIGEQKAALVDCWQQHADATKKDTVTTTIGFSVSYYSDPRYADDGEGGFVVKVDPAAAGGAGPDAAADACVRKVVEPILKAAKPTENIKTQITITLK